MGQALAARTYADLAALTAGARHDLTPANQRRDRCPPVSRPGLTS